MGLAFFFIKTIVIVFAFIIFIINKESENILNISKYDNENWVNNYTIRPKKIYITPYDMPIGTLIYTIYWNKVFDLTYLKILIGRDYFWIKMLKSTPKKDILIRFMLVIMGINKLIIKIIIQILYNKDKSLIDYLFEKSINRFDDRMIVRIDGQWLINGFSNELGKKIERYLKSQNKISTTNIDMMMPKINIILRKYKEYFDNNISHRLTAKSIFCDKRTSIPHWLIKDITKDKNNGAYVTCSYKANKKNYYGDEIIVNEVDFNKKSTILATTYSDIKIIGQERNISLLPIIKGSLEKGYNNKLLCDLIIDQINNYEKIIEIIEADLTYLQLDKDDIFEINKIIFNETIEFYSIYLK